MAQPAKLRAKIDRIVDHAPGLRSFYLVPERRVPRFKPGQFMHLALDSYDPSTHWPDSRCFSIASSSDSRRELRIIVSAVGAFTRRMMELVEDDEVWIKLPYGDFIIDASADDCVVLIAGGTGISPFMSFLSASAGHPCPMRVLYGARTPDLLTEAEALSRAVQHWPNLQWQAYIEQGQSVDAVLGRLNAQAALNAVAGSREHALFYLSGPPAMLNTIRADLQQAGVVPARILSDAWE